MTSRHESREWSDDPSEGDRLVQTKQTWVNRAIQASVLDMALNVGYMSGMTFDQLVCKATADGWLILVKAHKRGARRVAFVTGETFGETLELAAHFAERGCLEWQMDKWPPNTVQAYRGSAE